jgi:ABC-type lipoprotein export system ATPase subunit
VEDEKDGVGYLVEGVLVMLKLDGVYKSFGSIKVLENFSLEAEQGKSICIIGRSGCGKSTLLKIVALIASPDKGQMWLNGTETSRLSQAELDVLRADNVAYSFQEPLLIPYMSALENLTEIVGTRKENAVELLSQLGLSERLGHMPSKLSVGEKKRVDVARALLKGSLLLVADEPLSNLDPATGLKVMNLLKAHAESGGLVLYSSVEPLDAKFADFVINM